MECVFESPILYVHNKLLTLDISPLYESWAQSEFRGKIVKFGQSGTPTKKCYKMFFFIQNEYCKVHLIEKE
jgi:hypothetical protein